MINPLSFTQDIGRRDHWHICNNAGPLCGAELTDMGYHLPGQPFLNINLCLDCWERLATIQQNQQPNRIVIVIGRRAPHIIGVRAERPEDVAIIIYSVHTEVGTVFESKDITRLAVVDWVPCPDCEALIPPDGACWYCENKPIEGDGDDSPIVSQQKKGPTRIT